MKTQNKYYGVFKNIESIRNEFMSDSRYLFGIDDCKELKDENIIIATYDLHWYAGYAWIIFKGNDNNLYEVKASHCSCHGLMGYWQPQLTSWNAILMRQIHHFYNDDFIKELISILETIEFDTLPHFNNNEGFSWFITTNKDNTRWKIIRK